jgi:integrase/recombinase XerD
MRRPPEGPLAEHVRQFGIWAFEQGYSRHRVHRRVVLAAGFSQWLHRKGINIGEVGERHVTKYLQYRGLQKHIDRGDRPALEQLIEFLRRDGKIAGEKADLKKTPVDQVVQEFKTYLQDQRGLAAITIAGYAPYVGLFLRKRFGDHAVRLEDLRADDVFGFVRQESGLTQLERMKSITKALRSFFKYAHYRGLIGTDLAAAVPRVAGWSMPAIPRAISADQVRKLLSGVDRGNAKGRRDYAILLLLARLGLRSGEVAHLELEDIDWTSGTLQVRGKGRQSRFPLPQEVGRAIVGYLQHGRPATASRRLFVRTKAPFRGFRDSTPIAGIVRSAIERAGVQAPTRGAHQFRHGLATEMLRRGLSLKEIGDVLGHRKIQVTKIYAKVDIHALRTIALGWPGGVK